jgi:hypothetical protein
MFLEINRAATEEEDLRDLALIRRRDAARTRRRGLRILARIGCTVKKYNIREALRAAGHLRLSLTSAAMLSSLSIDSGDSLSSINWRGRPLRTYETVISLIGNTTNRAGLVVRARLDQRRYPIGKKVSPQQLRDLNIDQDAFHGDWNYVIRPRKAARLIGRLALSRALSRRPAEIAR